MPGGLFCAPACPLHDGIWQYEWVNGVVTRYTLHGKNIVHMIQGSNELHFFYDAQNKPAVVAYHGTPYSYVKNLQGDIVAILDSNKNVVVSYVYDAWGRPINCSGIMASTLGKINPFRYRGYVYDEETELYYLVSRYCNPRWTRFINSDNINYLGASKDFSALNQYTYCGNSPIICRDALGGWWDTIFDIVSLAVSVAEVIANPVDVTNWVGLIGDVVDVAVPFISGVGETARAARTSITVVSEIMETGKNAERVADAVDPMIDAAKRLKRAAPDNSDLKTATGTYVILFDDGTNYVGKGGFGRAIESASERCPTNHRVQEIMWAPLADDDSAFMAEALLQNVHGVGKMHYDKTKNRIWSPGKKKILRLLTNR